MATNINEVNPVMRRLGFSEQDRVVIIHTDDIGVCEASVGAAADLWQAGVISSSATMVPCAWFPATAALCRANPAIDMGVHLTLTSEWDTMRWGPISTRDAASGLIDGEGYFYRSYRDCIEHGEVAAVTTEIDAQVARALAAGIQPTHIDTHMGTALSAKFMAAYGGLALKYGLPLFVPRAMAVAAERVGRNMSEAEARLLQQGIAQLEEQGVALVDHFDSTSLGNHQDKVGELKTHLQALQPGITHFVMHPSKDTPELRAMAPDWRARVAEYEALLDTSLIPWLREQGIQVVGYGALK